MAELTPVPNGSLNLNCLVEDESTVFVVTMERNDVVSNLKEVIQSKRTYGPLNGVDPHALELWKVNVINDSMIHGVN